MSIDATATGNGLALRGEPQPPSVSVGARHFAFGEIVEMASAVAKSGLFAGITNDAQALALMLLCDAEGLHPIQAIRRFHIIKGRPSMRADAMQAEFQRRGGIVHWERSDATECTARFVHPVHAPDPGVTVGLTMKDAHERGLTSNDLYRKFPGQMLRARVISEGVRMVDPGVVVGIYTPEEIDAGPEPEARPRVASSRPVQATPAGALEAPGTIHVETSHETPAGTPSVELDGRSAVNDAFATRAAEADEPGRDARSKETTPLWGDKIGARGLDVREWADVQDGTMGLIRGRIDRYRMDELGLQPLADNAEPNVWSFLNHMVTATVKAGTDDPNPHPIDEKTGKRKAIGNGKKAEHLHRLYLIESWREWMRAEARDYLPRKLDEARAAARAEAGMPDDSGPEPAPEAVEADGQPAGVGDEGWQPGRE